jgi:hypothetical protein
MPIDDTSEVSDDLKIAVQEVLEPYFKRHHDQVTRMFALLTFQLKHPPESAEVAQDVLRAAVVLVHATLEDFLRTIALQLVPSLDEKFLNQVPLAESSDSGRAEKFLLGKLTNFRGNTVNEVLEKSVRKYLARSNFNNVDEIAAFLRSLEIEIDVETKAVFPALQALMERRHQIVHRGDRLESEQTALGPLCPITADQVIAWGQAVTTFNSRVIGKLASRFLIDQDLIEVKDGHVYWKNEKYPRRSEKA